MASNEFSIVVVSGTRERLQMAAMVAAVSAVSGNKVKVFLSMNALPFFVKDGPAVAAPEGPFGRAMEEKNVPGFKTLFQQAVTLGDATISPCSMAMDVLGVDAEALEPYLSEAIGLTKFLEDSQHGQMVSF